MARADESSSKAMFPLSIRLALVSAVAVVMSAQSAELELAFPSAEGFGALATGGRNGDIARVTNLDDSGPGSFREAVRKPNRFVVFEVGGVIRLKSNVSVPSSITLAGHSAPGEGICFYGKSVSFSGSSNVIVRYLRFRQGINGDRGKCSINISGGSNMIFDHCSIQWGRWDSLGVTQGSRDITFQHCIIGEAIDPQRFGALVDSVTNVTLDHNLWINNQSRNPKAKGQIQYHNNVVYNWGGTGLVGGHSAADRQLDAVGNYFIKGPSSNDRFAGQFAATDHVFQRDNYADLDRDGTLNGRPVEEKDFGQGKDAATFTTQPFLAPAVPVKLDSAEAAFRKVIASAGASLYRDAVDARLIAEVSSLGKLGNISRSEAEVGGMGELKGGKLAVEDSRFSRTIELEKFLSKRVEDYLRDRRDDLF
jgi:pectate lyase